MGYEKELRWEKKKGRNGKKRRNFDGKIMGDEIKDIKSNKWIINK